MEHRQLHGRACDQPREAREPAVSQQLSPVLELRAHAGADDLEEEHRHRPDECGGVRVEQDPIRALPRVQRLRVARAVQQRGAPRSPSAGPANAEDAKEDGPADEELRLAEVGVEDIRVVDGRRVRAVDARHGHARQRHARRRRVVECQAPPSQTGGRWKQATS